MARPITRLLTFLTFLAFGLMPIAEAQSIHKIKANIPFAFNFGGQAFPAGTYFVGQDVEHSVELRDSRGHLVARAFTTAVEPTRPANSNKLKFESIRGQAMLTEVWGDQDSFGERVLRAKDQTGLTKTVSMSYPKATEGGQP